MTDPRAIAAGARVRKARGFPFPGIVTGVFPNLDGQLRCAVAAEHPDFRGMLHIYDPAQLELRGDDEGPGGWIIVAKRMPEAGQRVLVCWEDSPASGVREGVFNLGRWWAGHGWGRCPSHWQPMPQGVVK